eukprot:6181898-Pleurochrysis_carterae.AAC.1
MRAREPGLFAGAVAAVLPKCAVAGATAARCLCVAGRGLRAYARYAPTAKGGRGSFPPTPHAGRRKSATVAGRSGRRIYILEFVNTPHVQNLAQVRITSSSYIYAEDTIRTNSVSAALLSPN